MSRTAAQQSLGKLGLTSQPQRERWAAQKSEQLAVLRRNLALGVATAERVTVRAAVDDYLARFENPGTKANKRIVLDAFVAWCDESGVRSLDALTPPRLQRWRDHLLSPKRCNHEPSTRNRWIIAAAIFFRWALARGHLPLISSDAIRLACARVSEPIEAIEFLRPQQIRKLLEACLAHDAKEVGKVLVAPFVLTLLLSGCRFAEAAKLQWHEVDLEGGAIRLSAARTKTKRAREIPFRETPTLGTLLATLRPKDASGPVFDGMTHSLWTARTIVLIKSYGAPSFSAHTLRRTAGTILTNAPGIYGGASAWHSAKRLGHSVEQSERDYAGQLTGLPATAATMEAAAGIEDVAARIVAGAQVRT